MHSETVDLPEATAEHRPRKERRLVELPGFVLLDDRSTFGVTVLDLSYDGCKIDTPIALLPGVHIMLSVLKLGQLDAHVRWYAAGKAGVSFQTAQLESKPQQPRQHERSSLDADVSVRRAGRTTYVIHAKDLSPSGCRLEFVERPAVGERLFVKFDGLDGLEAEVRWVEGFAGGAQFIRPIYGAVFEMLLAKLRS
jgi:hypothetical protein